MGDCHCRKKKSPDPAPASSAPAPAQSQSPGALGLGPGQSTGQVYQGQLGPATVGVMRYNGQWYGIAGGGAPGLSASAQQCIFNGDQSGWAVGGSAGAPVAGVGGVIGSASQGFGNNEALTSSAACTGAYVGDPLGAGVTYTFPLTPAPPELPPLPPGYQPSGDGLGSVPPGADMGGMIHLP